MLIDILFSLSAKGHLLTYRLTSDNTVGIIRQHLQTIFTLQILVSSVLPEAEHTIHRCFPWFISIWIE